MRIQIPYPFKTDDINNPLHRAEVKLISNTDVRGNSVQYIMEKAEKNNKVDPNIACFYFLPKINL